MSKWKLFGRSKAKEEDIVEPEVTKEEEEIIETEIIEESQPLAEHHETLESDKYTSTEEKAKSPSRQSVWRDVGSIEKNVDSIHIEKATKPHTDVEKTVDTLIEKFKSVEEKPEKTRKPSNVIYVVSSPQPGEVRGDWAVRGHGKIYSHHKTKENAINEARKIAKKRDATVMVQNTDGTFSEGFKPR